jgi:methylated-DNA-[protein]-cysteine S-methyltransferase
VDEYVINIESPVGRWSVCGTARGVSRVALPHEVRRASRGVAPEALAQAADQIRQYLAGERRRFRVRLDWPPATEFQRDVWSALTSIPYGQVRTYGEVAESIGRPRAMRAVGNANHSNPWPILIPCHRVVAHNGLGGYGGGEAVKEYLLELEGAEL